MVAKSLDEKIQERIKLAEKNDIGGKASFIVKSLSVIDERSVQGGVEKEGAYQDKKSNLSIKWYVYEAHDAGGCSTEVLLGRKYVFSYHGGDITAYVPGKWEEDLNRLYRRAKVVARRRESTQESSEKRAQQEERARSARENWGLRA